MEDLAVQMFADTFRSDPYPVYRRMRETSPVLWSEVLQRWVVTGYDECAQLLRSPDIGVSRETYLAQVMQNTGPGRAYDYVSRRLLAYEGADHRRLRSTVQGAFTSHRMGRLRHYIERLSRELLTAAAAAGGEVDLLAAVAHRLPSLVIGELIGLPDADRSQFDGWTSAIAPLIGPMPTAEQIAAGLAAAAQEWAFLDDWLDDRSGVDADDVAATLLAAQDDGVISRDEVIATIMFLFSAGHQTTRDLLGNGLHALLAHRDQWVLLVNRPALVPDAVTEMLRYDNAVSVTVRGALVDTVVGGVDMPSGAAFVIALAAANRDPRRFGDPDRFDVQRPDNRPLSFGGGAHHCLGAALARVEIEAVLRDLAVNFPGIAPAYDALEYRADFAFRGPLRLPVTLNADARLGRERL